VTRARRSPMPGLPLLLVLGALLTWLIVAAPQTRADNNPPCLGAAATIVGDKDANPGDGKITGTDGNDIIVGTEGNDTIDGGGGDDRICGQGGDDTITGGAGFDRVNGGPGQDTCDAERQVNCEKTPNPNPAQHP
jgi:hypothetical protein